MPTKDVIVTCLFSLPHSEHISNVDTECDETGVWFTWRGDTFKVSTTGFLVMMQIENGIKSMNNEAILMESLLKRAWINLVMKKENDNVQEQQ